MIVINYKLMRFILIFDRSKSKLPSIITTNNLWFQIVNDTERGLEKVSNCKTVLRTVKDTIFILNVTSKFKKDYVLLR